MSSYAESQNLLTEYEEQNLRFYCENDQSGLVLMNFSEGGLMAKMRTSIEALRNPFTNLYHWVKGEIYDLNAFAAAIKERATVQNNLKAIKQKIV